MEKTVLGYWNIRGWAAAARMMLEYGGGNYEDRTYDETSDWFERDKNSMGFAFPNLPYLIDGDIMLTESWAVYRYIGRKIGLAPETEQAQYEADMLQGVINTFLDALVDLCYEPNFEELKAATREKQEVTLANIEKFLEGRRYLTGPKLCFVDFLFYQTADHHRLVYPDIMDKYPNIKAYLERFESEEKIAAYMKSDRYYIFPVLGSGAYWGGKKQ